MLKTTLLQLSEEVVISTNEKRPLLRRRDVIDLTKISPQTLKKLVDDGVIPVVKLTGTSRAFYRLTDIERIFGIKL